MKALDPRSPLVVDTRELGRRPGASQRLTRVVPAPADLGTVVIGVATGSDLTLTLLLESVMEGVLVTGTIEGTSTGQCVRCLEDIERELEVRVQELYAYPGASTAGDEDVLEMEGDLLDLEPALRDALVPALPFQPVCRADCPGLPTQYGAPDDEEGDPDEGVPEGVDPRWAALAQLAGLADPATEPSAGPRSARPEPATTPDHPEHYQQREG